MAGKYLRGKGGKRYARKTSETTRKIAAYKKKNKRPARNAMRPFVETKFREVPRASSHHIIFDDNSGAASVASDPQLSINALGSGIGTTHPVPQNCSVIVPQAFSDLFTQGPTRSQISGRCIYPTYLNSKIELDWSAHGTPADEAGLLGHFQIIQGWAKNSLIKSVDGELNLPTSSANTAVAYGQIVAKALQQSGVGGDPLDFNSKKKDIVILKKFNCRPNLNNRYVASIAVPGSEVPAADPTTYALPSHYNFSWTIKRKQLLRTADSTHFVMADCWIPFVAVMNLRLETVAGQPTPDMFNSSKLYFTDQ